MRDWSSILGEALEQRDSMLGTPGNAAISAGRAPSSHSERFFVKDPLGSRGDHIGLCARRPDDEPRATIGDGGSGYLRTLLDPGHEALAAVVASRGSARNKFNVGLANELRRAYRGPLPAPRHLVDGVGLLTGPHAIWGMNNDLGLTERRIVERLAWMLRALTLEAHG